MVKIISDTSTLYTPVQAKQEGFTVMPLSVTVNGQTYREFEEITIKVFLKQVRAGAVPISSQPAIGDVLSEMEKLEGEKIVVLSMADGLSGTYQSACSARELMPHKEDITVINTKTLCGPHRYMVQQALQMAKSGFSPEQLLQKLQRCIEDTKSYLIPQDYEFLRRGGRLTPFAAKINTILKLAPVVTQTQDGKKLERFAISRNFESAVKAIIQGMQKQGVND
ncbi:MAG: DegV family protein, partial [Oscillospiraceae bacterium]|nr:DegV family protein [Oscillospiraceae bacterium]